MENINVRPDPAVTLANESQNLQGTEPQEANPTENYLITASDIQGSQSDTPPTAFNRMIFIDVAKLNLCKVTVW